MGLGAREDPLPDGALVVPDGGQRFMRGAACAALRSAHDAAALAARIARRMGVGDAEVRFVHDVALVHGQPETEVPELEPVRATLRHVTEHFDGSGGPDGLTGSAIPLPARIVRVAEEYVRCRHDDPARSLRARAGTRLDPAVVDALMDVLRVHAG